VTRRSDYVQRQLDRLYARDDASITQQVDRLARVKADIDRLQGLVDEIVIHLRDLGGSDGLIGDVLGVSRQAVQKRWRRESRRSER
jgi:hypothetical protein